MSQTEQIALSLLRHFAPDMPDKDAAVADTLAALETNLTEAIWPDVNMGQRAALIDYILEHDTETFYVSQLRHRIMTGNMAMAYYELGEGARGNARRQAWRIGNSQ